MLVERPSKYTGCLTSSLIEIGLYEAHIFRCVREVIDKSRLETGEERCIRSRGRLSRTVSNTKIARYCCVCVCVCVCVCLQNNTLKIVYVLVAKMGKYPPQLR